jgi:hypothetical protein
MRRWFALLLVAGCSTAQWDKPGATQASIDADLRACTNEAQALANLPAPRTTSSAIEVRTTHSGVGGVGVQTPASSYGDADTQLQQGERVQSCMRQKGYTLRSG